jgi:hypothetical protein
MRRSILIRFGIAIVVVTVIALVNTSFLGWGTFVTAAILAVPASRFRAYTAAFLPYGLVWLVFSLLRAHVAAILIWRKSPVLYNRFLLTTMITLFVGLLVYFLSPAAPPWLTADAAPQTDIFRVMASVGRNINSSLFERTYGVLGDPNPVAAMPSLHMAITFMLFWFALHHSRWLAMLAFLYSLSMAFALVYTGEHYVIDILVGSAITSYAYFFAGRWLNVTAPFFGGATQPPATAVANPEPVTIPPRSVVRDVPLRDDRQREEPA